MIPSSSYDVVCIADAVQVTKLDLPAFLHVLRPDGVLLMLQVTVLTDDTSKPVVDGVVSALTLGGFVKPHAEVMSATNHQNSVLIGFFFENYKGYKFIHVN